MQSFYLIGVTVLAVVVLVITLVLFKFIGLWVRAWIANAPVGLGKMVGMSLRKAGHGVRVDVHDNAKAAPARAAAGDTAESGRGLFRVYTARRCGSRSFPQLTLPSRHPHLELFKG